MTYIIAGEGTCSHRESDHRDRREDKRTTRGEILRESLDVVPARAVDAV